MNKPIFWGVTLPLFFVCNLVFANNYSFSSPTDEEPVNIEALSIEYLTGSSDMHGLRIGYRPELAHSFKLPLIGNINIEYETSLNLFDLHGSAKNEATYGVSFSPIIVKRLESFSYSYPLALEFGIGVSYVHDRKFGGVNIGSYYQFEDRIGLLMQLGEGSNQQLGLRYLHYSNGGLNTKNPGLDFISLVYIHRI